jgi:aromatic-L-amino-acid/L-tryptophan decarboxylase
MRSLNLPNAEFRALARRLADFSADYLERMPQLPSYPPGISGQETEALFSADVPWEGCGAAAFDCLDEVFRLSRPASPRFFGYVFGSGESIGALGEFAMAVLHQNAAAWRSAPAGVMMERTVVRWLASALGCEGFTGSLTLGGSLANLMGLCMAREAKVAANQGGAQGGVIYCSTEVHMSISKAAALLGLGYGAVRLIPVDKGFRMDVGDLRKAIRADLEAGGIPIAVVGSAGTTATGSIDPLDEIAVVCKEFGLWMHVDGAYGALASLAIPEAFRGLEQADSLSIDPHKWLYQPAGCGCLLYREPEAARRAFSHSGDYARVLSNDPVEGFAFFEESMELSRPARALKLWLSLRYYGLLAFQQSIREDLEPAQVLAAAIDAEPALERLSPVPLSVVCFRYVGGSGDLDELNRKILGRIIRRGRVYISNAFIDRKFALRACIVNHRTTGDDVKLVVSEVLAAAREAGA